MNNITEKEVIEYYFSFTPKAVKDGISEKVIDARLDIPTLFFVAGFTGKCELCIYYDNETNEEAGNIIFPKLKSITEDEVK